MATYDQSVNACVHNDAFRFTWKSFSFAFEVKEQQTTNSVYILRERVMIELMIIINGLFALPLSLSLAHSLHPTAVYKFVLYFINHFHWFVVEYGVREFNIETH